MVKKKFIYPWATSEFHSTLTITFEVSLKSIVVTGEASILNVCLHQKYLPKRVVSGRRCLLLVIKLSRCLEITCKWLTAPKQTNLCLPEVAIDYLRLQITDINFHFGRQIKRFQKPHSLQSVSSSLVLTIHMNSMVYLLRVWMSLYCFHLTSTWELLFSSVTNLLHAEFGKFYNFTWKNSQFQTIW